MAIKLKVVSFKEEYKSFGYAAKGAWKSLMERHVRFHLISFLLVLVVNYLLNLNTMEWAVTVVAATLVLSMEVMNTVIEDLMDFVHPDRHPSVGRIKDLAAGAVFFAAGGALIVAGLIYGPKIWDLLA
ncbi:diacylglycerol kinase [Luteibaculum oceani]|nr:diacylglycerol kinase family protein [Luteibaculum oceani]